MALWTGWFAAPEKKMKAAVSARADIVKEPSVVRRENPDRVMPLSPCLGRIQARMACSGAKAKARNAFPIPAGRSKIGNYPL
jgi:hypothetical protein